MSEENVELVRRLQPAPDVDIAQLVRDDAINAQWVESVKPVFDSDFKCVMRSATEGPMTYVGLEGLRTVWLDWTAPWAAYRTEIERLIDAGDRVVVLVRDFGRRVGGAYEVAFSAATVWSVRDGKVVRVEFFPDRALALEAAGLSASDSSDTTTK
jgi:ketosteroid isomerase-like protein